MERKITTLTGQTVEVGVEWHPDAEDVRCVAVREGGNRLHLSTANASRLAIELIEKGLVSMPETVRWMRTPR